MYTKILLFANGHRDSRELGFAANPSFNDLNTGIVLDVGSKHSITNLIKCDKYVRFDIDESSNPDICGLPIQVNII